MHGMGGGFHGMGMDSMEWGMDSTPFPWNGGWTPYFFKMDSMGVVVRRLVATSHLVGVKKEAGRVLPPAYLGWAWPCHRPHQGSIPWKCKFIFTQNSKDTVNVIVINSIWTCSMESIWTSPWNPWWICLNSIWNAVESMWNSNGFHMELTIPWGLYCPPVIPAELGQALQSSGGFQR